MKVDIGRTHPGNWNALRIFAVLIVIYGNGYILTASPAPGLWNEPFFRIGLHLLFAVSGYLLAASWHRDPNWRRYLGRRAARLFPGLAAAVLFTVLVVGALATVWPIKAYVLNGLTLRYLGNIVLVQQRTLPGVFEGQQWAGSVNPMLWTILAGTLLALCVPLFARLPGRWRTVMLLLLALGLGLLNQFGLPAAPDGQFRILRISGRDWMAEAVFFLMGMVWWQPGPRGERLFRADLAIIAFLGTWFVADWSEAASVPLLWLTLPYMAVCFGRLSAPILRDLPNISYGMYLSAFPIQQLIVARWPDPAHPIVACALAATAWGTLSWYAVEHPALRHGPKLPALWRVLRFPGSKPV